MGIFVASRNAGALRRLSSELRAGRRLVSYFPFILMGIPSWVFPFCYVSLWSSTSWQSESIAMDINGVANKFYSCCAAFRLILNLGFSFLEEIEKYFWTSIVGFWAIHKLNLCNGVSGEDKFELKLYPLHCYYISVYFVALGNHVFEVKMNSLYILALVCNCFRTLKNFLGWIFALCFPLLRWIARGPFFNINSKVFI